MTHLKSISVRPTSSRAESSGLKGQLFTVNLGGVDVFTGANGAGKTTRGILAVQACLSGLAGTQTDRQRPYLEPMPVNTCAEVVLSTGEILVRDLSVTKGKADTETTSTARRLVGLPPVSWDLGDWSSSTAGERAKVLDAVARAGGAIEAWDSARAQARVRELAGDTSVLAELLTDLPRAESGSKWLADAMVLAEEWQTSANSRQREAVAASKSAPRATVPHYDAARHSEIRRQIERADLAEEERRRMADTYAAEGVRLEREIARIVESGKADKQAEPRPSDVLDPRYQERLDAARAEVDAPIPGLPFDMEALRAAVEEVVIPPEVDVDALAKRYDVADIDLARLTSERGRLPRVVRVEQVCRACGAEDPLGLLDRAAEVEAEAARLDAAIAEAEAERKRRLDALTKGQGDASFRQTAIRVRSEREAAYERAEKTAQAHIPEVWERRRRAVRDAEVELERARERIYSDITAWERREAARQERLKSGRVAWKAANAALEEWKKRAPAETAAADLTGLRAESATLEAQRVAVERAELVNREAARLSEVAIKAVARWEASKALVSAIRQTRDEMASAAYQPIHDAARALVEGAAGLPVPYFRGPGDYGATVHGREVPYHGLSGSERLLTAACFVYALSVVGRPPVRLVLLDELDRITDRGVRYGLLRALAAARARGLVDSVLVTMATTDREEAVAIEGVTYHPCVYTPGAVSAPVAQVVTTPAEPKPVVVVADDDCPF